jgi:hypothetical protein
VRLEELGKLTKSNDLIGNRRRDLSVCSIVPQPTTLPRALCFLSGAPKLFVRYPKLGFLTCTVLRGENISLTPIPQAGRPVIILCGPYPSTCSCMSELTRSSHPASIAFEAIKASIPPHHLNVITRGGGDFVSLYLSIVATRSKCDAVSSGRILLKFWKNILPQPKV